VEKPDLSLSVNKQRDSVGHLQHEERVQTGFVGGLASNNLYRYFVDVGARKQEANAPEDDVTQVVPGTTEANAHRLPSRLNSTDAVSS